MHHSSHLLEAAIVFCTLESNCEYWQIAVGNNYKGNTAFEAPRELYQFVRVQFGLCHPLQTFQRTLDFMLSSIKWQFALLYLDNIMVFCNTPKQRIKDVGKVLSLLNSASKTLKLRKCNFSYQNHHSPLPCRASNTPETCVLHNTQNKQTLKAEVR